MSDTGDICIYVGLVIFVMFIIAIIFGNSHLNAGMAAGFGMFIFIVIVASVFCKALN